MNQTLTPQQLSKEGKVAYDREDFLEAAQAFEAAASGFASNGDSATAAEMANNRSVSLLQAGETHAALDAVGDTHEIFAEINDTRRQAMALGNKAAALAALDHHEEAEDLYRESARLLGEIGETELRATVMQSISKLQMRSGRYMEAIASMQSGLDEVERPSITQRLLKKLLQAPFNLLNRS